MRLARILISGSLVLIFTLLTVGCSQQPLPPPLPVSPPPKEAPVVIPPPTADFSASTTEGTVPITVAFTPETSGEVAAWHWNFGDGKFSNERAPQHTYSSSGEYTVSLTVMGPGGSASKEKINYINIASGTVSWKEAGKYIGQNKTVEGVVVGTNYASTVKGQPTFLNFNIPYKGYFTCVIWGSDRIKFVRQFPLNPEIYFMNKHVIVKGLIEEYPAGSGVPEMILKEPSQIEVITK
jgi:hypothetical protein